MNPGKSKHQDKEKELPMEGGAQMKKLDSEPEYQGKARKIFEHLSLFQKKKTYRNSLNLKKNYTISKIVKVRTL